MDIHKVNPGKSGDGKPGDGKQGDGKHRPDRMVRDG
jgi:hypothetical protein